MVMEEDGTHVETLFIIKFITFIKKHRTNDSFLGRFSGLLNWHSFMCSKILLWDKEEFNLISFFSLYWTSSMDRRTCSGEKGSDQLWGYFMRILWCWTGGDHHRCKDGLRVTRAKISRIDWITVNRFMLYLLLLDVGQSWEWDQYKLGMTKGVGGCEWSFGILS